MHGAVFLQDVPDFGNITKVKEDGPRNLFYMCIMINSCQK